MVVALVLLTVVTLLAIAYFTRVSVPESVPAGQMIQQRSGVVINMGSVDGVTGSMSLDYGASKTGMIGLTKSLALYGAPYGIRACCVSPGPVLTRPEMAKMKTRLGRAAEPEEIISLILYLCSDEAAFITGSNYVIDGGRSVGGM